MSQFLHDLAIINTLSRQNDRDRKPEPEPAPPRRYDHPMLGTTAQLLWAMRQQPQREK